MPIEVFFSYAHEDEEFRDELEKHLSVLKRQGLISAWHDRMIKAGDEIKIEIDKHINVAHVILLLISSDFLSSDYCFDIEMRRALERHHSGEARVIPIILRPCDWQGAPFGTLLALPKDGKAVTEWRSRDKAFTNIIKSIRVIIQEFDSNKNSSLVNSQELSTPSSTLSTSRHEVFYTYMTKRKAWQIAVALATVLIIPIFVFVTDITDVPKLIDAVSAYFANSNPPTPTLPELSERMQRFATFKNAAILVDSLKWYQNRGFLTYDSDKSTFVNPNRMYIFATRFGEIEDAFYLFDSRYFSLTKKTVLDELPNEMVGGETYWVKEHE